MDVVRKGEYLLTYDEVLSFAEGVASAEGWQSITDISHTQFKYICKSIGFRFFNDKNLYREKTNPTYFDYELLYNIYTLYSALCIKYNKIQSIVAFSMFANIEIIDLTRQLQAETGSINDGRRANPVAVYLAQNLSINREDGLKDRAIDKGGAVGVAIVGNAEYLWNVPGAKVQAIASTSSASLPDFNSNKKAIDSL